MADAKLTKRFSKGQKATANEFELTVAKALNDLEASTSDAEMKAELASLTLKSAKKITFGENKSAVLMFVPFRLLKSFRKLHTRLTRELEKKFGVPVVIIPRRRIQPVPQSSTTRRPFHRTLTAVHENLVEDVCYPVDVVGKRIRVAQNGGKSMKIFIDPREKTSVESKLEAFGAIYQHLTGKRVSYEFA